MTVRNAIRLTTVSLLLSLMMSSGEGVRLFPIPIVNDGFSEESSQTISSSSTQRYQYTARWFGSLLKQGNSAGENRKGYDGALVGPQFSAQVGASFPNPFLAGNFERNGVGVLNGSRNATRSRGPPTC